MRMCWHCCWDVTPKPDPKSQTMNLNPTTPMHPPWMVDRPMITRTCCRSRMRMLQHSVPGGGGLPMSHELHAIQRAKCIRVGVF